MLVLICIITSRRIYYSVQIIFEDEDERSNSRETNSMNPLICIGRISRCVEEEYTGRFRDRRDRIRISWGIFGRIEKRIWKRRQGGGESSRVKKIGAERENNKGIYAGVQKGSKRKWVLDRH